jgi:hypothetical protein
VTFRSAFVVRSFVRPPAIKRPPPFQGCRAVPARLSYPGIRSVTHYPRLSITDYPLTSVGVGPRRPRRSFRSVPFRRRRLAFVSVPSFAFRVVSCVRGGDSLTVRDSSSPSGFQF